MTLMDNMAQKQMADLTGSLNLRVLATTDLHAHLLAYDYFTDTRAMGVGLACLGTVIARLRAEAHNVLLFDNGDTLQGTPLADTALSEIVPAGRANPMIAAMNAMGFDAATLGNHDFDFGLDYLETSLSRARFPVVSANAQRADGTPYLPPSCILSRTFTDQAGQSHSLRIGITGVLPPQTAHWNRHNLTGALVFVDMVAAVAAQTAILRAQGVDLVIVLAHSGLGVPDAAPMSENVALQIAALPGVDAVVAGHTHKTLPDHPPAPTCGTPIVQPGAFGSHLGCIDLVLKRAIPADEGRALRKRPPGRPPGPASGSTPGQPPDAPLAAPLGPWKVHIAATGTFRAGAPPSLTIARPRLRRILTDFPDLRREVARDHRMTRAFVARPLGETAMVLETYFSTLAPCAATQVVADAQCAAAHPLINDLPALANLPLLSAVAPFKAGGRSGPGSYTDVPPGPLMLRHAADLYLYPNMLSVLRITGAGLVQWLERSASIYRRIDTSNSARAPQFLLDHDYAPYNFDRIAGLLYDIDVSRPARTNAEGDVEFDTPGRIRNLRFADGRPVGPLDEALVVTNSYRSAGGGHMDAAADAEEILTTDFSVRDAVARHIAASIGPIAPCISPSFTLRPLGGVPVIFETGPGALAYHTRLAALGLTPMGDRTAAGAAGGAAGGGEVPSNGFQPFLMTL